MPDNPWEEYLIKMRELEKAIRLTAFWTGEAARAAKEASFYADVVIRNVRAYLTKIKAS